MTQSADRQGISSQTAEIGILARLWRRCWTLHERAAPGPAHGISRWYETSRYAATFLKWRVFAPVRTALYRSAVKHLSWWPLDWVGKQSKQREDGKGRVVYYLRLFPTLTATFIQRELIALMKAEIPAEVIAHRAEDVELLGPDAKALMQHTHYLEPVRPAQVAWYAWSLFLKRPLRVINALLYTFFCRYDGVKSPALDLIVFARVVYLAGVLQEKGAGHVHAPWASKDAFVALVAARLLKIRYTVHARAYDIHRHSSAVGLAVKLGNADFVVTNSKYNESVIASLLPPGSEAKIRTIYNGIDLSRFRPRDGVRRNGSSVKLLSVGNLVEPKGLEYLLKACKLLKAHGYAVSGEIVGGRIAAETNYYIDLKKLRKALLLEEDVVFLGKQPFERVLERYQDADIFVLPAVIASHGGRDITPNVLIEAMAMKLPVISTISGAIPEIVDNEVSGILVPRRDEEALADAIVRLLTNESLREKLANNARRKIEESFDINKNIREMVALFETSVEQVSTVYPPVNRLDREGARA